MNNLRATFWVLAISLVAAGCNETHGTEMDAAITFDAVAPDAPDTAVPESNIGDGCRDDDDCDAMDSWCDAEFPGGYCQASCDATECPDGSTCIEGRTGSLCYGDCDLDAADGDFCPRDGYGCISMLGVCFPGCDVDDECPSGSVCDPGGGFNGAGRCADPDAGLGDACADQESCAPGQFCLSERFSGIPGGACGTFGCDPDANTGCPEEGICLPFGRRGGGVCLLACESDSDCTRSDQGCTSSSNGGYCGPSFVDSNLGQICSAGRGDCTGGFCATEGETGWPDSYCMATGCDLSDGSGCPGDGVCISDGDDGTLCVDGCAAASECRPGYDCLPSVASDPTSATACMPGCTASAVCGNPDFECNPGTGLCTEAFVEATLGEPCTDGGDCAGGRCLSEPDEGWPAGTCTYPGCRLSGTGREATCPTSSVCVDDATGDPELGVCVDGCTMTSDCRPGYACTGGACVAACTASDCGGTRTCNTTSGLCE